MGSYILRRGLYTIPVLFGVLLTVFVLMRLVPGDPIALFYATGGVGDSGATAGSGGEVSRAALERLRESYNLDKSVPHQFVLYVRDVFRADFGDSIQYRRPVTDIIKDHAPATIQLTVAGMAVALAIGFGAGIISAIRRHSMADYSAQVFAILGVSFPSFFLATILILIFAINLNWLPVISNGVGPQLLMPAITLGAAAAAILARLTRSSMLDVLSRDYIRTARAKGLMESKVIWIHALRNALIPVITVVGLEFGSLLGGAVAIEAVFFRQGLGMRLVEAIEARDYPVIQALVLLAAVVYAVVNLLVDILYTYVDPRVRLTDQTAR